MGDSSDHAKYAASSAQRRAMCPGSVQAQEGLLDPGSSAWAMEGTKAHKVLETALVEALDAEGAWNFLACKPQPIMIGNDAYDYSIFEPDNAMILGVEMALEYIHGVMPSGIIEAEVRVHLPSDAAKGEAWGTADVRGYEPSTKTLHIVDFKYGVNFVAAEKNRQLAQYGVSSYFSDWASRYEIEWVCMAIAQPRNYDDGQKIRTWTVPASAMFEWLDILDREIAATQAPNAPRCAGPHCHYCLDKTCAIREQAALSILPKEFNSVTVLPTIQPPAARTLDVFKLSAILRAKQSMMEWFNECEEYAHELARIGVNVPNYKVVEATPRRKWYGDPNIVAQQLMMLTGEGVEKIYARKLITITDAETLVRKQAKKLKQKPEELLNQMAFLTLKEPTGNTALVPVEDKRPALDIAHKQFSNVKGL